MVSSHQKRGESICGAESADNRGEQGEQQCEFEEVQCAAAQQMMTPRRGRNQGQ
jgi:hypothetical protein